MNVSSFKVYDRDNSLVHNSNVDKGELKLGIGYNGNIDWTVRTSAFLKFENDGNHRLVIDWNLSELQLEK
jgi:hypothetical protein